MVLSYTQFSWTWPTYYNINVISSKGVYKIYYFLSEKIKRYRLCSRTSFESLKIKLLNPRLLHRVFKKCIETRPIDFPQFVYMCENS